MSLNYGLTHIVVCPHRWWEEDQENHGVKQLSVLGAINKESLEKARILYKNGQIPVFEVSSLEVAEACKIAENAYRYIQIAFAEELCMIAEKSGIDFDELRKAMNTKWNVSVMEARRGIGKECLPKDTEFLALLKPELAFITRAAIEANNSYLAYLGQVKNQQMNKQEQLIST
jgi:UDP-N-acetyl-D-mannosaminuronate dehydrogenase